jgi:hypothetical protein
MQRELSAAASGAESHARWRRARCSRARAAVPGREGARRERSMRGAGTAALSMRSASCSADLPGTSRVCFAGTAARGVLSPRHGSSHRPWPSMQPEPWRH